MKSVNSFAKIIFDSFSDLEAQQVAVEFGVKLSGNYAIITSENADANFHVTLTWNTESYNQAAYREWID
jgi:hypothetical protein